MNQNNHGALPRIDEKRRRRITHLFRQSVVEIIEPRILFSGYALSFVASFDGTGGSSPAAALTLDSAGNLFGTTSGGGTSTFGAVFKIAKGSTTPVTIASLDSSSSPQGSLTFDSKGNLWGTTSAGGADGLGNVFEVPAGQNFINDVANFTNATGGNPFAGVTFDKNGNLFGTTTNGGANGSGTVFEIPKGTTTIKAVASFNGANGASPFGPVTFDSSGNLFGTTSGGGDANGDGAVFEIPVATTAIKLLAAFNGTNGSSPQGTIAFDTSGNLFGTTAAGGDANGDGAVFEIVKGAKTITRVANFSGSNGSSPLSGITIAKNGNLYGTTSGGTGASAKGTVFEILKGTTNIKSIASFNGTNGTALQAGVTFDTAGNLFGTAAIGGTSGNGTVFEIASGSTSLKAVASFNGNQGLFSRSAVAIDKSGDLFGTASKGGTFGDGTVYEIVSGSKNITTIGTFSGSNGSGPQGDVVVDSNGNLFGTTLGGGANGMGTIYEIVKGSHTIKPLVSFKGSNGSEPQGGLTIDGKGNIFGATLTGGADGTGVIFEIPHGSTTMKVLASFNHSITGNSYANVAVNSLGDIFGATIEGGSASQGAVYELPVGSTKIQALASFNGTNGSLAMGDVAVDASGNFFGATISGGSSSGGPGTVYELVKGSKTITDLVAFNSANGADPFGGITLDSNGNLFGTTLAASANNGEVFEIAKGTKTAQILAAFNGANGAAPQVTVKFDANGNLFGTTFDGGLHASGNVFKLTPTITATAPAAQSATHGVAKSFTLGSFVQTGAIGPFTVTVHWGDGSADTKFTQTTAGTITAQKHTFAKAMLDAATVTVADSKGHVSNVVSFKITVT